jgi:hypothetical protein
MLIYDSVSIHNKRATIMRDGYYKYYAREIDKNAPYPNDVVIVYRPPEEVKKAYKRFLDLRRLPAIASHPKSDLNIYDENSYLHGEGVLPNLRLENGNLLLDCQLKLKGKAKEFYDKGIKEISCGWSGEYEKVEGKDYHYIQKFKDFNHIAILERGRCGNMCSIKDNAIMDENITDGKKATIGETRNWQGKKYKKVAEGKWEEQGEEKERKEEKTDKNENLIQEAKKYKSADEFIKKQGKIIFRGGDISNKDEIDSMGNLGSGIYFSTSKKQASSFGNLVEAILPDKLANKNTIIKRKQKLEISKKLNFEIDDEDFLNDENFIDFYSDYLCPFLEGENIKQSKLGEVIKDVTGFDGITRDYGDADEILIFNTKKIKTKQYLIDIWNKANNKSKGVLDMEINELEKLVDDKIKENLAKIKDEEPKDEPNDEVEEEPTADDLENVDTEETTEEPTAEELENVEVKDKAINDGKKASIGTIKTWGGVKYKKVAEGKWEKVEEQPSAFREKTQMKEGDLDKIQAMKNMLAKEKKPVKDNSIEDNDPINIYDKKIEDMKISIRDAFIENSKGTYEAVEMGIVKAKETEGKTPCEIKQMVVKRVLDKEVNINDMGIVNELFDVALKNYENPVWKKKQNIKDSAIDWRTKSQKEIEEACKLK